MQFLKKLGIIIMILAIVGLIGYGFYQQTTANKLGQDIMANFLNDYAKKISAGDYTGAYADFTSENFKKVYTLENYIQAQQKNLAEYGELQSLDLTSGIFKKMKEPGAPWFYRTNLIYKGKNKAITVAFDMIEENGNYKIYRSFKMGDRTDFLEEKIY